MDRRQKTRPREFPGPGDGSITKFLPVKPHYQGDVARLEVGTAVIAKRRRRRESRPGRAEVETGVIEHVEYLCLELQVESLRQRKLLTESPIRINKRIDAQDVASQCSKMSYQRLR